MNTKTFKVAETFHFLQWWWVGVCRAGPWFARRHHWSLESIVAKDELGRARISHAEGAQFLPSDVYRKQDLCPQQLLAGCFMDWWVRERPLSSYWSAVFYLPSHTPCRIVHVKEGGGHIQPGIKEHSSENKTKAPISNMVIRWGGGASYSGTSPERGARVQQREARQPGPFLCSAPAGGEDAVTCVRACCVILLSPPPVRMLY